MDLTKIKTDELKRKLRFHENDTSTMTFEQECRRCYFIQEISAELAKRETLQGTEVRITPLKAGR